jgi:hypothetical protein
LKKLLLLLLFIFISASKLYSSDDGNFTFLYCYEFDVQGFVKNMTHNFGIYNQNLSESFPLHLLIGINDIFISGSYYELSSPDNSDMSETIFSIEAGLKLHLVKNVYLPVTIGYYSINSSFIYSGGDTESGMTFSIGLLCQFEPFACGINYSYLTGIGIMAGLSLPFSSPPNYK